MNFSRLLKKWLQFKESMTSFIWGREPIAASGGTLASFKLWMRKAASDFHLNDNSESADIRFKMVAPSGSMDRKDSSAIKVFYQSIQKSAFPFDFATGRTTSGTGQYSTNVKASLAVSTFISTSKDHLCHHEDTHPKICCVAIAGVWGNCKAGE